MNDNKYISNFINIANTCINLGFWPLYFKKSTSIIIPKPNKVLYNSLKTFQSIILLNTLGKLIEKVISKKITSLFYLSKSCSPELTWRVEVILYYRHKIVPYPFHSCWMG